MPLSVSTVRTQLAKRSAITWRNGGRPDTSLFDLIGDKEVLTCMAAEAAGQRIPDANAGEKEKPLRRHRARPSARGPRPD